MISNLRYLAAISKHGEVYGSKSRQKIRNGAIKLSVVNTDKLKTTHPAIQAANIMNCIYVDIASTVERVGMWLSSVRCQCTIIKACTLERSLQSHQQMTEF